MGVRSRSGSPYTPAGALAGTAAGADDPPAEAPRGTAAADRPAACPPHRGAAMAINRSDSSSAGAAVDALPRPADPSPGTAATAPAGTTAETADPPPGTTRGGVGGWPPGHPLHRGPAAVAAMITVALVEKAAADLARTHERTGLSKTDIVNRALSLYDFIDAELSEGAELIVRRDGRANLLKML
jgi:hypothetical protein